MLPVSSREIGKPAPAGSTPPPSGETPESKGGSFEERIVHARDTQKALTVSAVYRATELRAKTIGQMPVQYQRKNPNGDNFVVWMSGLGKKINYLLQDAPNPLTSGPSLWAQVTIDRIMRGNGFVYIERDVFGDPVRLWVAQCGGYDYMNDTYNITYFTNYGIMEKVDVPARDVLHFPNTFRYYNGFWGIPTLKYAAETLSIIKTEKAQALETAAKGGRMKLIIGEEKPTNAQGTVAYGMFDKKQMQQYADEINNRIYQKDVIALRGLEKVENISMSAQDMQLLEQLNLGLDDVARFWACPRPLLMLDTNSHYNDYSNATMEFMSRTIGPDKTEMEKEIARKLLGREYYGLRRIHICEKPLLAMDQERQAKVDKMNLETGAKTVNEIRAEHDMPAVENGDEPMASANLLTLKALLAKSAPEPGRPNGNQNNEGNEEEEGNK